MKKRYPLQIGGSLVEGGSIEPVRSPYDNSTVAEVYRAGPPEMEMAVEAAVAAFPGYRDAGNWRRVEILGKIASLLASRRDELAAVIVAEVGKPVVLAEIEVDRAVNTFTLAAEEAKRIGGEVIPLDLQRESDSRLGLTSRFPLGPTAAVAPFNFPLNLVAHKVAPALAAGNTLIVKPASSSPVSSLLQGEIAAEAGLPPGVMNVVPSTVEAAASLVTDPRVPLVTFTGSAAVGWGIRERAGRKKVLLELGGDAYAIVEPDADLEYAARRIALGCFAYAGQVCIAVQHVLVHRDVYGPFRDLFLDAVGSLGVGDPRERTTIVGPVIDRGAADRVLAWSDEAVEAGAKKLCGGGREGQVIAPIVLEGTGPSMKVGCEEVFGPLSTLNTYDDFDEALERVNGSSFGLQAGLFTASLSRAFDAFRRIETGGVIINDFPTFRVDHMPYGGVKGSGLGREGVRYAIEEMTEPRLMVLNLQNRPEKSGQKERDEKKSERS